MLGVQAVLREEWALLTWSSQRRSQAVLHLPILPLGLLFSLKAGWQDKSKASSCCEGGCMQNFLAMATACTHTSQPNLETGAPSSRL